MAIKKKALQEQKNQAPPTEPGDAKIIEVQKIAERPETAEKPAAGFPIVGIGASAGMTVQANCTYIIPPGRDMAFLNGTLQLLEPSEPRGQRLPIDFFFRSLAQDQHERAICPRKTRQILHELQAHQFELEMHNGELRRTPTVPPCAGLC